MSRNYDNWERLVAAVLKKEQLWQLFHAQSSPSISSESSGFSLSLGLSFSLDDAPFSFSSPVASVSVRKGDDNGDNETVVAATPSRILVKNQSPVETLARKRDLRIQVPKPQIQYYGVNSPLMATPIQSLRAHPRGVVGHTNNSPDDAKQQSYPLPLPPDAVLFKIRNHRELPTIPDQLSDEGQDFLRRCLQWDPLHRATASQLLEHPFVKSSSPVVLPSPKVGLLRKRIGVRSFSGFPTPTIDVPSEVTNHKRGHLQLDSGTLASHPSRA